MVPTIVDRQAQVVAPPQAGLISQAPHIVQEDGPCAVSEQAATGGCQGQATAQLPTHHLGSRQVPQVVTHGSPCAVMSHLHAALTLASAISQTHLWQICGQGGWVGDVGDPRFSNMPSEILLACSRRGPDSHG